MEMKWRHGTYSISYLEAIREYLSASIFAITTVFFNPESIGAALSNWIKQKQFVSFYRMVYGALTTKVSDGRLAKTWGWVIYKSSKPDHAHIPWIKGYEIMDTYQQYQTISKSSEIPICLFHHFIFYLEYFFSYTASTVVSKVVNIARQ